MAEPSSSFPLSSSLPDLQHASQRIQAIIADPLQLIFHRSQCCSLANAYALAVQEVQEQIHKALTTCPSPSSSQNLAPSLTALHHAMVEGEKFISDCVTGIKKALTLTLSTEAVDVHFHNLLWNVSVVGAAVRRILGTIDGDLLLELEPQVSQLNANNSRVHDIYDLLNGAMSESSRDEDLGLVLSALEDLKATVASSEIIRFTKFIFDRLSNRPLERISGEKLPPYLWVDRQEFQILGSLGCGGYAAVYKVEWLGEKFAMKEFSCVGSARGATEVFEREAAIQASLQHPNVVQFICCTETPDGYNCGLVMELMQRDLGSLIAKRVKNGTVPPFSLPTAVDIMLQIAKGMEYLHSKHIMHRDLKSFNVLVSSQEASTLDGDGRVRAKISDFGMSKAKYMSSKYTTMHAGTTYWRAPEVFEIKAEEEMESQPNAKYTKKADVYSFAMVCYEILSGKIPFKDVVSASKLHKKLIDGVRPRLPSSCPQILATYIAKCWHADASRRPPFAEICRALGHLKGVLLTFADPMLSLTLSDPLVEKLVELMDAEMNIPVDMSYHSIVERNVDMEENEGTEDDLNIAKLQDGESSIHVRKFFKENRTFVKAEERSTRVKVKRKRTTLRLLLEKLVTCVLCKHRAYKLEPAISSPTELQQPGGLEVDSAKQDNICEVAKEIDFKTFTFEELSAVTKKFRKPLGKGGYGAVFWGSFPDGQEVAVKRLFNIDTNQGEGVVVPELMTVGLCRHENLVPLRGWCLEKGELLLVYDFMPNGSLEKYLYGDHNMLEWEKRYKIVCGLAAALHYLHHECSDVQVVHRDVKPSNVLLDGKLNARLGDFGLAKLLEEQQEDYGGGASSEVVGTMGYLDPQYIMTGELGTSSDVYSFGVVVLEVACGRRVIDRRRPEGQRALIPWLNKQHKLGRLMDATDPNLQGAFDKTQMKQLFDIGLRCTHYQPKYRLTMVDVLRVLSKRKPK